MDRASSFAKVAKILRDRGFDVLTYDRPGYASARHEEPRADLASAADDLLARIGERDAIAVGHSFGGHVAMLAAIRRPDVVRAVGVYETPYAWEDFWPSSTSGARAIATTRGGGSTEDAAEEFMRSLVGDRVWARLPQSTRATRRAEGRALLADLLAIFGSPPYDPSALPVPLVAGRGSEALPHHAAGTAWICQQVPGAEVFTIDGAGHGAHRSHPAEFAAFVRRVVARASDGHTRA